MAFQTVPANNCCYRQLHSFHRSRFGGLPSSFRLRSCLPSSFSLRVLPQVESTSIPAQPRASLYFLSFQISHFSLSSLEEGPQASLQLSLRCVSTLWGEPSLFFKVNLAAACPSHLPRQGPSRTSAPQSLRSCVSTIFPEASHPKVGQGYAEGEAAHSQTSVTTTPTFSGNALASQKLRATYITTPDLRFSTQASRLARKLAIIRPCAHDTACAALVDLSQRRDGRFMGRAFISVSTCDPRLPLHASAVSTIVPYLLHCPDRWMPC